METYYGHVNTIGDALRLIEAVRFGLLPLIQRRLNGNERACIRSGSVFIFDASKSGVQRWTDGFRWSASRLHGHFLTYHQKDSPADWQDPSSRLIKRALSVVTADKRRFGLISYYSEADTDAGLLLAPTRDAKLRNVEIPSNYYFRRVTQLTPNVDSNFLLTPLTEHDAPAPDSPRRFYSHSPPSSATGNAPCPRPRSTCPTLPSISAQLDSLPSAFNLFPPMSFNSHPSPHAMASEDLRQLQAINSFF